MADHEEPAARGLFGGVFDRGGADTSDAAWLQAMLDAEAALARALERAGLAPAGSGAAVTAAAQAANFDVGELGSPRGADRQPGARAGPGPGPAGPAAAAGAVHRGATSQDIVDTAAMLLAKRAIGAVLADLAQAAAAAAGLAGAHRSTIMIGRTLLQQAVPVTFGLVAAGWLTAWTTPGTGWPWSARQRLAVQFGGAAGTLARSATTVRGSWRCWPRNWAWPGPLLPWHTDRLRIIDLAAALARVTAVARQDRPRRHAAGAVRDRRGPRGRRRPGSAKMAPRRAAAAPPPCRTSATRSRRSPSSAAPGRRPACWPRLVACAEQEQQRAAGAWHAEWEPLTDLLRLTGSAASWAAELLSGPDRGRRADGRQPGGDRGAAARRARHLAAGRGARRRPGPRPGGRGGANGRSARGCRCATCCCPCPSSRAGKPRPAGITPEQIESALDPAGYLGAADAFVTAALQAHQALEARLAHAGRSEAQLSEGNDDG